ncbi:MAG TPA: hypothetical protein VE439_05915 [Anaerolineae bacterium]|nr:hypothetical protein [Anaerolineae bacterium]
MTMNEEAATFISDAASTGRIGVLYHTDADGIAGAVIIRKLLERLGSKDIVTIPLGRGINPHSPETREQLVSLGLLRLIVVDSGSRAGEILPGIPTLVIDHHRPSGRPRVEVFFNTYREEPARPASLAVYDICNSIIDVEDLDWVAAIGTVGDLGPRAPFSIVERSFAKYGKRNVANSVVLINAGRRHRDYSVQLAFDVLLSATEPVDIVEHRVAGAEELERMRREVQDEL